MIEHFEVKKVEKEKLPIEVVEEFFRLWREKEVKKLEREEDEHRLYMDVYVRKKHHHSEPYVREAEKRIRMAMQREESLRYKMIEMEKKFPWLTAAEQYYGKALQIIALNEKLEELKKGGKIKEAETIQEQLKTESEKLKEIGKNLPRDVRERLKREALRDTIDAQEYGAYSKALQTRDMTTLENMRKKNPYLLLVEMYVATANRYLQLREKKPPSWEIEAKYLEARLEKIRDKLPDWLIKKLEMQLREGK